MRRQNPHRQLLIAQNVVALPARGAVVKNLFLAIAVCALALLAGAACGSEDQPDMRSGRYQSVSAGSLFTCAAGTEGLLRCWGQNEGHEEGGFKDAPKGTYRMVSSGYYGSCALRAEDGKLKCWGRVDGKKPSDSFATIDVATFDVCGIRLDGTLTCWGRDLSGLSGFPEGTYTTLSAGGGTACAIRTDGKLVCWGGIEERDNAQEIADEMSVGTFEDVSVGAAVCGLRPGGEVECWENRNWIRGSYSGPPDGPFRSVSVGGLQACGIRPDGRVECWGRPYEPKPLPAAHLRFQSLSASTAHACGITDDKQRVVCWGKPYGPR